MVFNYDKKVENKRRIHCSLLGPIIKKVDNATLMIPCLMNSFGCDDIIKINDNFIWLSQERNRKKKLGLKAVVQQVKDVVNCIHDIKDISVVLTFMSMEVNQTISAIASKGYAYFGSGTTIKYKEKNKDKPEFDKKKYILPDYLEVVILTKTGLESFIGKNYMNLLELPMDQPMTMDQAMLQKNDYQSSDIIFIVEGNIYKLSKESDKETVQLFFQYYNEGEFKDLCECFLNRSGQEIFRYTKEDFTARLTEAGNKYPQRISMDLYNILHPI